jgi:alkyl hydroperoxide reductase subunit AhpC
MSIRLGDLAPDFEAETTVGPIRFHAYKQGRWAVLFSHPRDFTPVCTTELGRAAALAPEFARRDCVLVGLSVDPLDAHLRWHDDIALVTGQRPDFPMVADPERRVATLYGMLHPNASDTATVRSVFVIGPDDRVKLMLTYPASTGRNFDELLRVLDSLQLTARHAVATPADWRYGEDVIITPAVSDAEAVTRFPRGFVARTPYLRLTPQPDR